MHTLKHGYVVLYSSSNLKYIPAAVHQDYKPFCCWIYDITTSLLSVSFGTKFYEQNNEDSDYTHV
jgi:hypothetical protein